MSIELQLKELSEDAERLRAALRALSPDEASSMIPSAADAARAKPSRHGRAAAGDATQDHRLEVLPNGRARTVGALVESTVLAETAGRNHTVEEGGVPAGAEPALATGADRAVQELRRELTAALRNSYR